MRALFLAAHNDDEVLFGTFSLLRHLPFVYVCFKSERMGHSSYPGKPVTSTTREDETEAAMDLLGCKWRQSLLGDMKPDYDLLEGMLWGLRDPASDDDWDLVFAPAIEEDGHEQHNMVGEAAKIVFSDCELVHYLTYTSAGKSRGGTEVQYEPEWIALKHRALACYTSQCAHPAVRSHFIEDLREYMA